MSRELDKAAPRVRSFLSRVLQMNKALLIFNWNVQPYGPNALFHDEEDDDFYLGIFNGDVFEPERKVRVGEALRWYAETGKYGDLTTGSVSDLCEAAAKIIKRYDVITAEVSKETKICKPSPDELNRHGVL